ncbi:MAG TPA: phosphotransferase [Conexibacter sp.]|jgi:aminoglycoside phosphotransferase (APT) family kinase protein
MGAIDELDWLRAWAGQAAGGEVVRLDRLVAGNSRVTWAVDVSPAGGGETVPLVVRVDGGDGPFSGTPFTLAREAAAYAALQSSAVAIPRLHGFDLERNLLAVERCAGEPRWNADVLDALLGELALLHSLDVDTLELPGEPSSARGGGAAAPPRSALDDLGRWAWIAEHRVTPRSPFADFAVSFLRERFPGEPERTVFVHGDAGIGNLLWDGERITALLDWELSHLGDPIDDLAFLTVRSALFGVELPDFGARVRARWAGRTGIALDSERLRYWQAVGILRNLLTCLASISNPARGRERLVHHLLVPSLNCLLVEALAAIDGVALEPAPPLALAEPLPGEAVMREIAQTLADVVPAIADEEQRQRARRARHLLAQLAETWPLAAQIAALEQADAPPADEDDASRLQRLARTADRELALFPRALPLAHAPLASFD